MLITHRPRCHADRGVVEESDFVFKGFGGWAATHPQGTVPATQCLGILTSTPWVVVTVPALVLCARLLGWSQEVATTSLATGLGLIPFGRLHVALSLLPPRRSSVCF